MGEILKWDSPRHFSQRNRVVKIGSCIKWIFPETIKDLVFTKLFSSVQPQKNLSAHLCFVSPLAAQSRANWTWEDGTKVKPL